ncbi:sensor histidine kinase [Sphingomonas sp. PB4P5]|uniref:sensor histidine kinase n=1 Tax=Parasphingomonas puruogangriensis TaxID=3096155 RepID=UPI002FCBB4C5
MNTPTLEVQILRNIARTQLLSGKLAAADRTIAEQEAISRSKKIADTEGQSLSVSAQSALQHGDLARAALLIGRSFAGVDLATTTLAYRGSHETAYNIYKRTGEAALALSHLEALKRLDDKKSALAASANTSLAAARFDFANQELRIAKLKADELQRNIDFERAAAVTRQNIAIGIAVVVMVIVGLLAIGIVTLRRSRDQVRAANIDLAATNTALAKALAAKTEFLATTSHEIRTPLNGILGMTQVMLTDRTLSDALRDRIEVVHGAGVTMRALVDDILDVAKIETGNLTIEQAPFDLRATLGDVAKLWQEQAKARGIGFVLDVADSPDWIEGDAARLRQIVFNLLSNALKFTEQGTVTLRACAAGARLSIAVSDSGIGIPPEKHELIFESFRQVDAGTTRKFGGTGLGLAICRNLARAMDGDVRVDSALGQGATFTLDLPLIHAAAPAMAPMVEGQKALLILDRSPITRSMLRAVLQPSVGAVLFAASVEEAVEAIHAGQVAQVLIDDATITAADDRDAALSAIVRAAAVADVGTSLLSTAGSASDHAAVRATGIGQIIVKPITAAALIAKLAVSDESWGDGLVSHAA